MLFSSETVQLAFKGNAYTGGSAATAYVQWVVGGTAVDPPDSSTTAGTGWSVNMSHTRLYTFAAAGTYTVKIQAKYATATWQLYDAYIAIAQYRGGYTIPENIPILEYNSASQIHLHPPKGAVSTLRAALNSDGKIYTYGAPPLVIDLTVSGRGGLDTGTEAVSTWYYAYLVPDAAGTGLAALCSVTPPLVGPTGYPVWRYVGAFRPRPSASCSTL